MSEQNYRRRGAAPLLWVLVVDPYRLTAGPLVVDFVTAQARIPRNERPERETRKAAY